MRKYLVDTFKNRVICEYVDETITKKKLINYMGEQGWELSGYEEIMSLDEIIKMGGLVIENRIQPLTDEEWIALTRKTIEYVNEGLRLGQSYMNALKHVRPEIYDKFSVTNADCFYVDEKIVNFIQELVNLNNDSVT